MDRLLSCVGSAIVTFTVFLFALFLIIDYPFAYFFVCLLLPIGYIMMTAGFYNEAEDGRKAAAMIGVVLSAVYCVLVMLVYFSQVSFVRLNDLSSEARNIIEFKSGSLTFCCDLLGYGMMALSTFFTGLAFKAKNKPDKWLKALLLIHGTFFPGCFIMPMTSIFSSTTDNGGRGGSLALVAWCVYFLPVGILAFIHFKKNTADN